jgi:hypothetical protein
MRFAHQGQPLTECLPLTVAWNDAQNQMLLPVE